MTYTRATRLNPRGASLVLVGAMCVLPFLQPRHFPPIRSFYDEWFAFALGAAAVGMAALGRRPQTERIPTVALWLAAFALFLTARALPSLATYPQGPLMWAMYMMFATVLIVLGHDLATHFGRELVCDTLASFLLLGALLNSIAGVLQVIGIPKPIDDFVSYLSGSRAIGNVGQANLYANYLALGTASLTYLFARGRTGLIAALAAGLLLLTGASLAGSRLSTLYSALFAALGYIATRNATLSANRRLGMAAATVAICGVVMQWLGPIWVNAFGFSVQGGFSRSTAPDWESVQDESIKLRLVAWEVALRLFAASPIFGVGPGEFAGAAFANGIPNALAAREIWTSPHNLVLQLLSETGIAGTLIVAIGLWTWLRSAIPDYVRVPTTAGWWVMSCVGVEFLHALVEYPFWYANFIGLIALIMGVGSSGAMAAFRMGVRTLFASCAIIGVFLLGISLRDYFEFDLASPVYAGRSLASEADRKRDLDALADLGGSLLAPKAELWLFLSVDVDGNDLAGKIAMGNRVMHTFPIREVVIRQCVFLALDGQDSEARKLLSHAIKTFPKRRRDIYEAVESAPKEVRHTLTPAIRDPL